MSMVPRCSICDARLDAYGRDGGKHECAVNREVEQSRDGLLAIRESILSVIEDALDLDLCGLDVEPHQKLNDGILAALSRPSPDIIRRMALWLYKREGAAERGGGVMGPWQEGKCRVPMWMGGLPAGFCGEQAFGHQLPARVLWNDRNIDRPAHCHGHCCPMHGGPRENEPRIFMDGYTTEGRPMWCAVFPDYINLHESHAAFDGDPIRARAKLLTEQVSR